MALRTLPGYALVQLTGNKYEHVAAPTKVYEAPTSGILLGLPSFDEEDEIYFHDYKFAVGKTVYWQELNAVSPLTVDGKDYAYVKLMDIMGYNDGKPS